LAEAKTVRQNRVIKSLGLVFGDIGTSPIYTLSVVILLTEPTHENIIGILSLIVWTLTVLVSMEYAWLAMSLGKDGEGGTIVLKELLVPLLKSGRSITLVTFASYIGISLLVGDGVITPAISILSAVEGIQLIPGLEGLGEGTLVATACAIAVALFALQKKGTERISGAFGPIMVVWFLALFAFGMNEVVRLPRVLEAFNPYYAVRFLADNGFTGFFTLSEVILCATGGEALYADMGHMGRDPIVKAWYFVLAALLMNYFGQGAFVITHPGAKNILFEMVLGSAPLLYVPFLLLSIMATVIASQAMISGMFSIVYQGMKTYVIPMLKVDFTSEKFKSQIYIGTVNWFLLAFVLLIIVEFRQSAKLAAAYGLAVTGTMTLTGILMTWIFHLRGDRFKSGASAIVTVFCTVYLLSNVYKIPHGGYWSIIIALIPFLLIILHKSGQSRLYRRLKPISASYFAQQYNEAVESAGRIKGTALFFSRDFKNITPYIFRTMFVNGIIYEVNIIISISVTDRPFGVNAGFREDLAEGLRTFVIQTGYMEIIEVETVLRDYGIDEKAIFYGLEDIITDNPVWKLFSIIKKLSPAFVQFYKLPSYKLHGVISRVEL
jgi:KUP system potassium uptake protein